MSDASVQPPLRIQVTSSKAISCRQVESNLIEYLSGYHERVAKGGGDSSISVRLQNLSSAIHAERHKAKEGKF